MRSYMNGATVSANINSHVLCLWPACVLAAGSIVEEEPEVMSTMASARPQRILRKWRQQEAHLTIS